MSPTRSNPHTKCLSNLLATTKEAKGTILLPAPLKFEHFPSKDYSKWQSRATLIAQYAALVHFYSIEAPGSLAHLALRALLIPYPLRIGSPINLHHGRT